MSETLVLLQVLIAEFGWNKSRLECFAMIIIGMISAKSVNLASISEHARQPREAKFSSVYKRIQRFFAEFDLHFNDIAKFIFRLFDFTSCSLIIDRTNWWFGEKHINYLVLSIRFKNVAIPLFWVALGKCGNSTAFERVGILKRFVACFGKAVIHDFCGDREFACIDLLKYLFAESIPFTLRIKGNYRVKNSRGKPVQIKCLLRGIQPGEIKVMRQTLVLKHLVDIVAYLEPDGELVIIATNHNIPAVQDRYINRNQIETMFKAMKTQGFNLEDTHITRPDRLERLMGAMAISFAWSYKMGDYLDQESPIKIKSNGRRVRSVFKTGLTFLVNLLGNISQRFDEFLAVISLVFQRDKRSIKLLNFNGL